MSLLNLASTLNAITRDRPYSSLTPYILLKVWYTIYPLNALHLAWWNTADIRKDEVFDLDAPPREQSAFAGATRAILDNEPLKLERAEPPVHCPCPSPPASSHT